MARLSKAEITEALKSVPAWQLELGSQAIARELCFEDFMQAFQFMQEMASIAEAMNHHPEWSNVYKLVRIRLTTHDVDGLSALDIAWAEQADAVARKLGVKT